VIDGSHAAGSAESVTVCDSNEMANLLNQQQIVVKVFVTFYKTGNVALVSGNHANVPAQPQIGELTIQQQADSSAAFVASPPVTLDMAALNVDIGSSGSCQVSTANIHVSLGAVNKAEFKGKNTTGGGEALLHTGLLLHANRYPHRLFWRHLAIRGNGYSGAK
jgi:hypothetical protein